MFRPLLALIFIFAHIHTFAALPQKDQTTYILIPNLLEDGTGDISFNILLARSFTEEGYKIKFLVPPDSLNAFLGIYGRDAGKDNYLVLDPAKANELPSAMPVYSINNPLDRFSIAPWLNEKIDFEKSVFVQERVTPWPLPIYFQIPPLDRKKLADAFGGSVSKKILNPQTQIAVAIFGKKIDESEKVPRDELEQSLLGYATAVKRLSRGRPTLLLYRSPFRKFGGLSSIHDGNFQSAEIRGFVPYSQMAALLRESPVAPFVASGALWPLSVASGRMPILHLRTHYRDDWLNFLDRLSPENRLRIEYRAQLMQFELNDLIFLQQKIRRLAAMSLQNAAEIAANPDHQYRESVEEFIALKNRNFADPKFWIALLQRSQADDADHTLEIPKPSFDEFLAKLEDLATIHGPKRAEDSVGPLKGLIGLAEHKEQAKIIYEGSPAEKLWTAQETQATKTMERLADMLCEFMSSTSNWPGSI